jgi:hypothetical protein
MSRRTWYRYREVKEWNELIKELDLRYVDRIWNSNRNQWVFRGMSDSTHQLKSSLERELERNPSWKDRSADAERIMIREYKRRAHHYTRDTPGPDEDIEWLAMMRHYGAPTRLLDWTKSPFVALFFAVHGAVSGDGDPAVWILNIRNCSKVACRTIEEQLKPERSIQEGDLFDICQKQAFDIVFPIEPFRMNERLAIQQGLLLYPGNIQKSFDDNLSGGVGMDDLVKLIISRDLIPEVMLHLHMVNISNSTLFPGIDGFSVSMRELLWSVDYIDSEPR